MVRTEPFKNCTIEKQTELRDYWIKTRGEFVGERFATNAVCLDMEGFYLAGEPHTLFEANLVVHFEWHPDIIRDETHKDYNEE